MAEVLVQPGNVNFDIEVPDIANDHFILHHFKMSAGDQVTATGGNHDVGFFTASIIFFTSKPSIAACRAQIGSISVTITRQPAPFSEAAEPFTHITISAYNGYFTGQHHIGCAADSIQDSLCSRIYCRISIWSQSRLH